MRPGQPERLSLEQRKVYCGAEPEEQAALLWKPRLPSRLQGAVLWAGCGAGGAGCVPSFWGWCEIRAVPGTLGSACSPSSRAGASVPAAVLCVRRCASLGDRTLPPKGCTLVSPPALPSLIGYCWNLRLGAKRRAGRLKPFSREKQGNAESVSNPRGPHRVPIVFSPGLSAGGPL